MAAYSFACVLALLAHAAPPQENIPKTVEEAAAARKRAEDSATATEKESVRRGLGALDEARATRGLAEVYGDFEKLLKQRDDYARDLAGLPARLAAAQAELAASRKAEKPAAPITEMLLGELRASLEARRAALYDIELQLNAAQRLASGGAYAEREHVRADAVVVDRARRALATGSSGLGPKAEGIENSRIELRVALHRELLAFYEMQESNAQTFINVLRAERDVKKKEIELLGEQVDRAGAEFRGQLEAELARARDGENAETARCEAAAARGVSGWEEKVNEWNLVAASMRRAEAGDRLAAANLGIDRALAGLLADERARLQSLKEHMDSEAAENADVESGDNYREIQELLGSKEIQDLKDGTALLRGLAARARLAAARARRDAKKLDSGLADDTARAAEELDREIRANARTAVEKDTILLNYQKSATAAQDAIQSRARAASHLDDRANARLMVIQRLLDTLAEEEQVVRARGLFVRVPSQFSFDSIRAAASDLLNFIKSSPRHFQQLAEQERDYLTNRDNLQEILQGSGMLAGALLLLLIVRRLAINISKKLPVSDRLSIFDRAKRLAIGLARRMAVTGFLVIAAIVLAQFVGAPPVLARAVTASALVVLFVRLALALASALLRPDDARFRLVPVSDATARYVFRVAVLASMSVFAVDVPRQILDAIGYTEHNPGFMFLLAHVKQGLVTFALILLLLKNSVLEDLLPRPRHHSMQVAREVLLKLRTPFLLFAIALFGIRLAGYEFLAVHLGNVATGGATILILAALARGAVVDLWSEIVLKRLSFGALGAAVAIERRAFLDRVVRTVATVACAAAAYIAFVAILRIGATELRAVDVGLVGGRRFNVSDLLYFVLAIAATVVLARWTRRGIDLFAFTRGGVDVGTRYAIAVTASYLVIVLGFLISLSVLGFQLQDFAIVLGAAGFGVGLGMQETAANFICGLLLLFNRPVKVGDEIESDGRVGTIVDITITSTRLLTGENYEIIIPNREIVGRRLINHTGRDPRVRGAVRIAVAFGTPVDKIRKLLLDTAGAMAGVSPSPSPQAVLVEYGASALNFELRFWADVQARSDIESQLRIAILEATAKAGVALALPEQVISVRGHIPRQGESPDPRS
ncbi:MAG: mechanosensitive ion channel [Planctomycetes bacterium]|nr:mechanosensitive ion channel [Planctomycetota bacterium]